MTIDGEAHETIGDILSDTARHTSRRALAVLAWAAGAVALATWLAGRPSWLLWLACYAVWAFAVWALAFTGREQPYGLVASALRLGLLVTGAVAAVLAGVLVFYALLGPRWQL